MQRILVTGMSGTGKSTALIELEGRGFHVVDTDEPRWSKWSDEDGGYVWREDLIAELSLATTGRRSTCPAPFPTRDGSTRSRRGRPPERTGRRPSSADRDQNDERLRQEQ